MTNERARELWATNTKWRERRKASSRKAKQRPGRREELNAYLVEWRKKNPELCKEYDLKKAFGMTLEQFKTMYEEQKGLCAVCGEAFEGTPCVDHDHATGEVRGLVHDACNKVLG